MKILKASLPDKFNLFLLSDLHKGTILHHEHGLKQAIDIIASSPLNYVAILGDLAEAITLDDKRYDKDTVDPRTPVPLLQYQELAKEFKPIKKKIITVLEGNHDWVISNKYGNGVRDIFCKELETPFGTYSSKIIFNDKKNKLMFKAFLTHGYGSVSSTADDPVRRQANMELILKRRLSRKAGDAVLMAMGHSHKLIVKPPISELYLSDDGLKPKQCYTKIDCKVDYIPPDLRWYCFDKETEILTETGYKKFADLSGDEKVYGLNPATMNMELLKPTQFIKYPYRGKMVAIQTEKIDLLVTPEHNLVLSRHKNTQFNIQPAIEVLKNIDKKGWAMPSAHQGIQAPCPENLFIAGENYPADDFMKFLGWYLSEGYVKSHTQSRKRRQHKFSIIICQSLQNNQKKYKEILLLCSKLFNKISSYDNSIHIKDKDDLARYLLNLGTKAIGKRFPIEWKHLHPSLLSIFLETFRKGDGSQYKSGKNMQTVFYTSSPGLKDDLYELIVRCGQSASVHSSKGKKEHWSTAYRITVLRSKRRYFKKANMSLLDYDDMVYCVSLPQYHIVNVKRNDKNILSGNCNTGSFYKLYSMDSSGYAERHGYDPNELGFIKVIVEDRTIQNIEKIIL